MSFREVTIAELENSDAILAIQDGNHGEKHPKANDYVEHGIPFIMASDLRDGRVDLDGASKLPQSITDRLRIGFCHGGDVLLSHKGSVGYVAIAPEYDPYLMLTPQVTYYRVNEEKLSHEFLSYAFRDPTFQKRLASAAGQQGTRGYVGITAQRKLKLRFGEKSVQDRLVSAVKPYDDLIENNRRRIALLEDAARMLYREWFVRFRFPGHEHVKIIVGIPEGWERCPFGQIAELKYGKALKEENRVEGFFPVYGSSGIVGTHQAALVEGPTIIVGRKGNVGSIYWSPVNFWPIDTVYFIPKEQADFWLYLALPSAGFQNTDAGVPGLNRDFAYSRELTCPAPRLRRLFNEAVEPMFAQRTTLENYNQKLAQARDLLLPRLMNGEIAV